MPLNNGPQGAFPTYYWSGFYWPTAGVEIPPGFSPGGDRDSRARHGQSVNVFRKLKTSSEMKTPGRYSRPRSKRR